MTLSNQEFKAAAYLRLSKEDAVVGSKKTESDSITNQKSLILNFIKEHPDIEFGECYIDDGYTGVLFDRPAFKTMLDDIAVGKINALSLRISAVSVASISMRENIYKSYSRHWVFALFP